MAVRVEVVDQNAEGVAFESGIQIIILRCAMIDAETCAEHGFPMQCAGCPGQCQPRVNVHIAGIV